MTKTDTTVRKQAALESIRALWHVLAIIAVTTWGFLAWPFPVLSLVFGFSALLISVLLWALFLSPKPVLRADKFAQSMIEILLIAGAVWAFLDLNINWIVAVIFGTIGLALGYIAGLTKTND